MFCTNCGNQVTDNSRFCTQCGAEIPNTNVYGNVMDLSTPTKQWGMKWHGVLQVFLVIGMLLNFTGGINAITGAQYLSAGISADMVYKKYGESLHTLDVMYGIVRLCFVPLAGITVYKLHKLKCGAPKLLLIMYAIGLGLTVFYAFFGSIITSVNLFDASTIASMILSIAMIAINKIYYDHRSHLFVNY
jgi:tryptophan-rich sensory protein